MKRRNALGIYAYVMLGVSLVLCAIGLVVLITDLICIVNPELGLSEAQVLRYGHNDNYRKWMGDTVEFSSEDDVTKHRTEAREVALGAAGHAARLGLKQNAPFTLIFGILALVHWRIVRRLRRKRALETTTNEQDNTGEGRT